jgi:sulfur relay (sulfurtransferase) complex TusBCD TusD component (DsrE family)
MDQETVILFTRNGMGDGPAELQATLVKKFLSLLLEGKQLPAKILFYTDGVKLACQGSVALEQLKAMEAQGVELVLCQTCLNFFQLADQVQVGVVGGMGDMIEAMSKAGKVLSL